MIINSIDEVSYYSFELLAPYPELRHGIMCRRGPDGKEWTFSYGPENDVEKVNSNIDQACQALGLKRAIFVGQVHGIKPLVLAPTENYLPRKPEDVFQGFDAIISAFGQSMMVKVADCQGIIIYDPASRVLALVHSGWRGSAKNIVGRTIRAMVSLFKLDPATFLACVSPSLGPCCAEFINYKDELPQEFWAFKDERDYFDFTAVTRSQLEKAGVKEQNIEFSGICSRCSKDFYSHRRGDKGRFAIIAGVVPLG
ncbi:MAG: polyphenol oxidase family protein [Deltaproteobacteria bacterium]|jgi:YfiH family protein|nr:polyphenol oxidase family protein [Deltaproteobacteria bacterium]